MQPPVEAALLHEHLEPSHPLRTLHHHTLAALDAAFTADEVHLGLHENLVDDERRVPAIFGLAGFDGFDVRRPRFDKVRNSAPRLVDLSESTLHAVARAYADTHHGAATRCADLDAEPWWPNARFVLSFPLCLNTPVPQTLTDVDVVASYARPLDDQVKVVLSVPGDLPLEGADLALRFQLASEGGFKVLATAERAGDRWRVQALAPSAALTPGLWKLRLRVQQGELIHLASWLMVSDTAPMALLSGSRPDTRMEAP